MSKIFTVLGFGWKYLRRYWVRLVAVLLFSILFAMANGCFIGAVRTIFNCFTDDPTTQTASVRTVSLKAYPFAEQIQAIGASLQNAADKWLPHAGQPMSLPQSFGIVLFLMVIVGFRASSDYLSSYCMGWVSERVVRDMRLDIMEKLSSLSLDFFTRSSTGDLLTRINVDSQNLLRSFRQGGADLIKESISLVVILIYLLALDWKLTLWTMILLPACMFPLVVLGKKARRAMTASLRANISQSSQLVELLGGIRVIKAFNLEREEMARFKKTSGQLVHAGMKGIQAKELVNPIIEIISALGFGALLFYFFKSGRTGKELVSFLTGIALFFLSVKKLAGIHILFEQANVGVQRLIQILAEQPKVVEPENPKPFTGFNSAITFDNVSFAYGEKEVVRDFNFTIPRGFKLGLAGESGSGKTTLVNLLFRFYDATRGALKIDGLELREISIRDLRQQMALVSQDIVLFDQTIAENIGCGKAGASMEEIEAAAKAAFAHDFIVQLPDGYQTRAGERGVRLSGGQRQRICIARAFVRNAPILVLDEATASLDSNAEAEVQAAIDKLAEHRTVICIAHRLSTLSGMDKIIVLTGGQVVEVGSFDELLQKRGAFCEMAARQGISTAPVR